VERGEREGREEEEEEVGPSRTRRGRWIIYPLNEDDSPSSFSFSKGTGEDSQLLLLISLGSSSCPTR
jgi:hypothetical protein